MKSYKVSEDFRELEEFTLNLPVNFDRIGEVIQDNRNVVKKVTIGQSTLVIKNFRGMYFFNRLAYSLFRKSKAERSFLYSEILNKNGILTPPPVAWLNCFKGGLLAESYFISVYRPYKTIKQVVNSIGIQDVQSKVSLFQQLAAHARKLHQNGIYHDDFSTGNILVNQTPDGYEFSLVDLNRVKFHPVSYRKGLRHFNKLNFTPDDLNILIGEYAKLSNQSQELSRNMFWADRNRASFLRSLRRKIRQYTLTPLEKVFAHK